MNYDPKTSVFTRTGSFRTQSLTEQLSEPNIPFNAPPQPPPFLQSNKGKYFILVTLCIPL